ncbi:hypothetical protein H7I77_23805 [Mycolicibacterium novocastrense]|uniref:Cellulose biosynthesis cyclic di-GMP-binding regulatory protein BcsB n=1 Tax=Mycolicibacterium novocastrense TaxID=59813 RepID=A0AAW5SRY6_MYCNV|nr:hypothetical protein [Mycolicibacterium novocastrense]MCV7026340.1 hypothetical protein [Mycolicibacterium novocastrense]GAT11176.1 uncharacterized protein RMCN_4309 [Mycolicibacterium novocastrense]
MKRGSLLAAVSAVLLLTIPVAAAAALVAPAASAQPDPPPAPGAEDLRLSWSSLGLPSDVRFVSANTNQDFRMPLPAGFTPRRLQGQIHAPVNFGPGFVEIEDARGTFLGAVNLPTVSPDQAVVPFDVDLSQAPSTSSPLTLSFTVRQNTGEGQICGPGQELHISQLTTIYAGAEPPPTTVDTFFAPVLQRLTIYAPGDADRSEQEAVLALASAVERAYQPQPVSITVANKPRDTPPPAAGQLTRAIAVERGTAGLTLTNPGTTETYLRLSGRGDQLTAQVALLRDDLQSMAQTTAARVDQAVSPTDRSGDTVTFGELSMEGKDEVLRTSDLTVGVDRAALGGGRLEKVRVHLLADYTPVDGDDVATLVVRANDDVVHSAELDTSGRVDTAFDVPSDQFGERLTLTLTVTYTPRFLCSSMIAPLTFQIDEESTLTVTRGGAARGGFAALPSGLMPAFLVALDGSSPNQLDYAARVLVAMARVSSVELIPRVVELKSAAASDQPALIVASSAGLKQTDLNPPVSGEGSAIRVDGDNLRVDVERGVGSVQAFADTPRDRPVVLVTTTAAWPLVDPLIGYIEGLPGGWSGLTGDVLAAGAQGTPTDVAIRSDVVAQNAVAADDSSNRHWGWIAAGVAVLVALAIAAGWLALRRRLNP